MQEIESTQCALCIRRWGADIVPRVLIRQWPDDELELCCANCFSDGTIEDLHRSKPSLQVLPSLKGFLLDGEPLSAEDGSGDEADECADSVDGSDCVDSSATLDGTIGGLPEGKPALQMQPSLKGYALGGEPLGGEDGSGGDADDGADSVDRDDCVNCGATLDDDGRLLDPLSQLKAIDDRSVICTECSDCVEDESWSVSDERNCCSVNLRYLYPSSVRSLYLSCVMPLYLSSVRSLYLCSVRPLCTSLPYGLCTSPLYGLCTSPPYGLCTSSLYLISVRSLYLASVRSLYYSFCTPTLYCLCTSPL